MLTLYAALAAAGPALHQTHQVGIAMFPAGLQYQFEGDARFKLSDSDGLLFRSAHVALIGRGEATPAYLPRVGVGVRIEPIAFFDATARVTGTYWLGTFSAMVPTGDPGFVGGGDALEPLIEAGGRTNGFDLRVDLDARLKLKVWRIVSVTEVEARRHDATAFGAELEYWYEPGEMLTIPAEGFVIDRKQMLLFEVVPPDPDDDDSRRTYAGFAGFWPTCPATGDSSLRVGALVATKVADGRRTPTIFVGATPWLKSRFAEQYVPYLFAAANWSWRAGRPMGP